MLGWKPLQRRVARDVHRRRAGRGGHGCGCPRARRGAHRHRDRARGPRGRRCPARLRHRREVAPGRVRSRRRGARGGARGRRRERRSVARSSNGWRSSEATPRPSTPAAQPYPGVSRSSCSPAATRSSARSPRSPDVDGLDPDAGRAASDVRTPASSLAPLIHHSPTTGLEGKFSLEYGIAAALLDGRPGFDSFTDDAVARAERDPAGPGRRSHPDRRRRRSPARGRGRDRDRARRRLRVASRARAATGSTSASCDRWRSQSQARGLRGTRRRQNRGALLGGSGALPTP